MGGRRAISAKMIDNQNHKKSNDEIDDRLKYEPKYQSQIFECPSDFNVQESTEWNELADMLREMEQCPVSDAHRQKMIVYVRALVIHKKAFKDWQDNPVMYLPVRYTDENGKEKIAIKTNQNWIIYKDTLNSIKDYQSGLMLDVLGMAKMGIVRTDNKKKESKLESIFNRKGDE